jgi:CRISPR-associated protein Cmr4
MARGPVLAGLRADSFIHVGTGQSFGEVDLPFVREPATDYPFIPGSVLKGALRRAFWEAHPHIRTETDADGTVRETAVPGADEKVIFGDTDDAAGLLLVGDARLAFLPVRSLGLGFRYLTCPTLLARALRDCARCDCGPAAPPDPFDLAPSDRERAVAATGTGPLFLEEYRFTPAAPTDASRVAALYGELLEVLVTATDAERQAMAERIVLIRDEDFEIFARHALPVRMRNRLNEHKLVEPGALWSEEYLPPETLLYAVLADRRPGSGKHDPVQRIRDLIATRGGHLQVGGNETVGQGLVQVRIAEAAP